MYTEQKHFISLQLIMILSKNHLEFVPNIIIVYLHAF